MGLRAAVRLGEGVALAFAAAVAAAASTARTARLLQGSECAVSLVHGGRDAAPILSEVPVDGRLQEVYAAVAAAAVAVAAAALTEAAAAVAAAADAARRQGGCDCGHDGHV